MKKLLGVAVTALFAGAALAQAPYPSRAISMVVGFAPGGGTDTASRIIAKKLGENLGQPVVVENKAGAGGNIATDLVAKSAPDGYTILLASVGSMAITPHLPPKPPYDPLRDLAPITMAVVFPNVLVVHPSMKTNTLAEFVALAKAKPGAINYGSSGIGNAGHLAGELFRIYAKIDIVTSGRPLPPRKRLRLFCPRIRPTSETAPVLFPETDRPLPDKAHSRSRRR